MSKPAIHCSDFLAGQARRACKCDACVQARVPTPAKEAQQATAGSRPTSTEIASQIEGFEDDFRVSPHHVLGQYPLFVYAPCNQHAMLGDCLRTCKAEIALVSQVANADHQTAEY